MRGIMTRELQDPIERFKNSLARWKDTGFALYDATAQATADWPSMEDVA